MPVTEALEWLSMALVGVGLIGACTAWFSPTASDGRFVFYVILILAGVVGLVWL